MLTMVGYPGTPMCIPYTTHALNDSFLFSFHYKVPGIKHVSLYVKFL